MYRYRYMHSHTVNWCFNCQLIFAVFNKNVLQMLHIFCHFRCVGVASVSPLLPLYLCNMESHCYGLLSVLLARCITSCCQLFVLLTKLFILWTTEVLTSNQQTRLDHPSVLILQVDI